jgi:hypothetical protein
MEDLYINNMRLEQIHSYKYLGSIINRDNSIEEEIRERIVSGNRAYYANRSIIKSKLVCKKSKLKIYQTIVRPVVTYGCETWVLKEAIKPKLLVFERKILRGIFGPTNELNGTLRIKTNSELNKLIENQTVIKFIKAQRLSWLGHIHRMGSDRTVKKVYEWKPISMLPQGRPKLRWENDIKNDLKEMKLNNWRICIQDRNKWKRIVEKAKTFNV